MVQYRNGMLPLLSLAEMLGAGSSADAESLSVIVYRNGSSDLGLVVDEITDIVVEPVTSPRAGDRPGLLGSAVVGGAVTDFLDLEAVVQWAGPAWSASLERLEAALV